MSQTGLPLTKKYCCNELLRENVGNEINPSMLKSSLDKEMGKRFWDISLPKTWLTLKEYLLLSLLGACLILSKLDDLIG